MLSFKECVEITLLLVLISLNYVDAKSELIVDLFLMMTL